MHTTGINIRDMDDEFATSMAEMIKGPLYRDLMGDALLTCDPSLLTANNAPATINTSKTMKVRRKRPYTQSSYVCDKCRKSHRKCIHPSPHIAGQDQAASLVPHSRLIAAENASQAVVQRTAQGKSKMLKIHVKASIPRILEESNLPRAPVEFYVRNLATFFSGPDIKQPIFWSDTVPQLAQHRPLLARAMLGLCYLFEECPRPTDLAPQDVLRYLETTLQGLRSQLARFQELSPVDKVVSVIVTTFLAIATYHGIGPTSTLQLHIHGIHAMIETSWADLTAANSPARRFFLSTPSHLSKAEQLPINLSDLHMLEPLIQCITDEELNQSTIRYGSLSHLLVLTNKAIHARRQACIVLTTTSVSCSDDLDNALKSETIFRDFVEYRANLPHDENVRWASSDDGPAHLARVICKCFEQATFMQLKNQSGVREHNLASNLATDVTVLRELLHKVNLEDSKLQLHWPELVLQDLESFEVELLNDNVSSVDSLDASNNLCRRRRRSSLQPWVKLDKVLRAVPGSPLSSVTSNTSSPPMRLVTLEND